jgi:flavin-binding protein dodecin
MKRANQALEVVGYAPRTLLPGQPRESFEAPETRTLETPIMKDPVYKLIELTGSSTTSVEDAVAKAIKRAHKTLKNLSWFQVVETRGNIDKGKVHHWQVTIKVGFEVED